MIIGTCEIIMNNRTCEIIDCISDGKINKPLHFTDIVKDNAFRSKYQTFHYFTLIQRKLRKEINRITKVS